MTKECACGMRNEVFGRTESQGIPAFKVQVMEKEVGTHGQERSQHSDVPLAEGSGQQHLMLLLSTQLGTHKMPNIHGCKGACLCPSRSFSGVQGQTLEESQSVREDRSEKRATWGQGDWRGVI